MSEEYEKSILSLLHDVEILSKRAEEGEFALAALDEWRKYNSARDCVACAMLDAALAGDME